MAFGIFLKVQPNECYGRRLKVPRYKLNIFLNNKGGNIQIFGFDVLRKDSFTFGETQQTG